MLAHNPADHSLCRALAMLTAEKTKRSSDAPAIQTINIGKLFGGNRQSSSGYAKWRGTSHERKPNRPADTSTLV